MLLLAVTTVGPHVGDDVYAVIFLKRKPQQRSRRECPENGGMTTQEIRSVGSIADRGNGDAMGVAVDCDRG
jgi:hypothetical protein